MGFALAGVIVATAGPGWAVAVDAVTYGVAAACFAMIRAEAPTTAGGERLLAELAAGAREVLRHTWLWLLIGQALLYHLCFGGAQGVLGPIVVGDTWGEEAWGGAMAALMGGFVLGGLIALRWRPRHLLRWGVVLLSLTAAFPLAMALADQLWLVLAGAAVHGIGLQLFGVSWDLAIQENVAEDKLSRVYAFDLVGSFVCRPPRARARPDRSRPSSADRPLAGRGRRGDGTQLAGGAGGAVGAEPDAAYGAGAGAGARGGCGSGRGRVTHCSPVWVPHFRADPPRIGRNLLATAGEMGERRPSLRAPARCQVAVGTGFERSGEEGAAVVGAGSRVRTGSLVDHRLIHWPSTGITGRVRHPQRAFLRLVASDPSGPILVWPLGIDTRRWRTCPPMLCCRSPRTSTLLV